MLVSCTILPHGGIAREPSPLLEHGLPEPHRDALALHAAARVAAAELAAARPDLILLLTPHGFASDSDWGVYTNCEASGTASDGRAVDVRLDTAGALSLLDALRASDLRASAISFGAEQGSVAWPEPAHVLAGSRESMPLFWGEVNPLAFVLDAFQEAGTAEAPAVVILSLPTRQDGQQRRMHGECEAVGAAVDGWVGASGRRVGVLGSADLAHTHPSEHHLPGYTLGPGAQPFASMSPSSPPTLLAFCPCLRVLLFTHRSEAFSCGACAVSAPGAAAGYDAAVSDWAATLRPSALLVSFFGREAFLRIRS